MDRLQVNGYKVIILFQKCQMLKCAGKLKKWEHLRSMEFLRPTILGLEGESSLGIQSSPPSPDPAQVNMVTHHYIIVV